MSQGHFEAHVKFACSFIDFTIVNEIIKINGSGRHQASLTVSKKKAAPSK